MMESSAVIVSATTFCDVERKPFALALYRQHRPHKFGEEWRGPASGSLTSPMWQGRCIPRNEAAVPAGNAGYVIEERSVCGVC